MRITPVPVAETRPLRQAVLRPQQVVGDLAAHEPPDLYAVAAVGEDGSVLAVGHVGREGGDGAWRVRGMATAPEARGQGLGSAVLNALIEHAAANGATRVWCHGRVAALSLYERAGFEAVSDEFDKPHSGPHYVMEKWIN